MTITKSHTRPSADSHPYRTYIDTPTRRYELRHIDSNSTAPNPPQTPTIAFNACEPPIERTRVYNFLAAQILAYESTINSREELPVFATLTGTPDAFELYIRDSEGGEYLCWTSDELANDHGAVHAAISAVKGVYETPQNITETHHRTQIETTD